MGPVLRQSVLVETKRAPVLRGARAAVAGFIIKLYYIHIHRELRTVCIFSFSFYNKEAELSSSWSLLFGTYHRVVEPPSSGL